MHRFDQTESKSLTVLTLPGSQQSREARGDTFQQVQESYIAMSAASASADALGESCQRHMSQVRLCENNSKYLHLVLCQSTSSYRGTCGTQASSCDRAHC